MSSTALARLSQAQVTPTTEAPTVWPTPQRWGWNASPTGRRIAGIVPAFGLVAILIVALYSTVRLSGISVDEARVPASVAVRTSSEHEPHVGSWIVRSPWMSSSNPPLLMTFVADGSILVTDRAANNTGHGHWIVTRDGVAFEFVVVELDGNGQYAGITTAHGSLSVALSGNEWSGFYTSFLTTPAGNVPTAMAETELNGERVVAEPPRGPDQGPSTPSPRS